MGPLPRPTRRLAARLAAVPLAAASVACGDGNAISVNQETFKFGLEAERAPTWKPTATEPITIELNAPRTVARAAEVPIRVNVHNGSDHPVSVGFGQRRGFNVMVSRARGPADSAGVWSVPVYVSTTRDATVTDPLPPGRDTVFSIVWPGVDDAGRPVPAGAYRLRATVSAALVSTRQLWTAWTPITVVEK